MNYYLQVLSFVGIHALLGLSVYLVLSTGQLTLGNAGFMALGGYTAALLSTLLAVPFWLTIPLGGVVAAIVAVPLGYATLRLRGVYLAIATLGFTESVRVIMTNIEITGGPLGIKNIPNLNKTVQRAVQSLFEEAPLGLTHAQFANLLTLLAIVAVLAVFVVFVWRQGSSRVGRAYAAIRTDEIAAGAMGINTTYYKVLAFTQGAFIAGVGGALMAHTTFSISPTDFGFSRAVEMLTYVVVGGSGVPLGAVLGAASLILLSEGLRDFKVAGHRMADYRLIIYGALMMVIVWLRPAGLLTPNLFRRRPAAPSGKGVSR